MVGISFHKPRNQGSESMTDMPVLRDYRQLEIRCVIYYIFFCHIDVMTWLASFA